jgi:hypothetical protein
MSYYDDNDEEFRGYGDELGTQAPDFGEEISDDPYVQVFEESFKDRERMGGREYTDEEKKAHSYDTKLEDALNKYELKSYLDQIQSIKNPEYKNLNPALLAYVLSVYDKNKNKLLPAKITVPKNVNFTAVDFIRYWNLLKRTAVIK